jgi:TolB-like protein
MTATRQAIFLSYASEDASAGRHLCKVLREAGLEVWFDQSELRGGDAWDASIRQKIKECALFVPLVSANTNARSEGYFRLEWKLAVDRSHLMADDQTFLLPVLVDDSDETTARVPDRFRERQWSRLSGAGTFTAFVERAVRLVCASAPAAEPLARQRITATATPTGNTSPGEAREPQSIAVLPFVNMSRDEENEYFADGLSEELLNVLAKIRGLRVASRTSAFAFKGKNVDIPTIAGKLNVATVLEGSVRKAGKRVRITAQLIEVATDSHLWSETYDRELDDIFAVQDDIAQSVVKELRSALMGGSGDEMTESEVRVAASGRSHDPEAFQLYLQGKFFGERVTQLDTDKAIELFRRALAIDPEFALAWTGLSTVLQLQAAYGFAPIETGYEAGRQAAKRALALVPDLVEAHVALSSVYLAHDWDWNAANASIQRALALAPGDAGAVRAAAFLARIRCQWAEGLELARQAIEIDPLSPRTYRQAAMLYLIAGRLEEATTAFRTALELDPITGLNHAFLAVALLLQGRLDEALPHAQAEAHDLFRLLAMSMIDFDRQNQAESDTALQVIIDQFAWTAGYQIAELYAYRKEIDKAFEWLDHAYAHRDPGVMFCAGDILLRALHDDPRWQPFLARLGLSEVTGGHS